MLFNSYEFILAFLPLSLLGFFVIGKCFGRDPAIGWLFLGRKIRLSAAYAVLRYQPEVISAGNSRPEMGLDPTNPCFSKFRFRVYNLGIPGSTVYMQVRFIQNALSIGFEKLVLYGVDFFDFLIDAKHLKNGTRWPPLPRDFDHRLRVTATGRHLSEVAKVYDAKSAGPARVGVAVAGSPRG